MTRNTWYSAAALWALCCGAVLLQYWPTLSFGFVYDDYHFIRPYDLSEVLRAFHSTWDAAGIERAFYRPLTVVLYALRFEAFGLNERAYHIASLIAFATAGALTATLAWRVTGRIATGVWVVLFWTVHPDAPISLAVWITNQMHLAQTLVIVLTLWWWWRNKAAEMRWWLPLLLCGCVAFMIKEDGIILLPVVIIAHELYRWLCDRRVPHAPLVFVVSAGVMLVGLFLLRRAFLGGMGGYGAFVTSDMMLTNLIKGPSQVLFLGPASSPEAMVQAWGMTVALVAGSVVAWRRQERPHLFLIALGVLVVVAFDLPFAMITKREQYYALTLGAVLAFGACSDVLTRWPRLRMRLLVMVPLAIVLATMSVRSVAARDLYAPFSESTLATDRLVEDWAAVPAEIRQWLHRKVTTRDVSRLSQDLPYVVFGANDLEHDPRGNTFRWTGARVWIYPNANARSLAFDLRAGGIEQPPRPFVVEVTGGRPSESTLRLEPGQQEAISVDLRRFARLPWRNASVEIDVDHTWSPGPQDQRRLGVILSDITVLAGGPHRIDSTVTDLGASVTIN